VREHTDPKEHTVSEFDWSEWTTDELVAKRERLAVRRGKGAYQRRALASLDALLAEHDENVLSPTTSSLVVADDRSEHESCERSTQGCCVSHSDCDHDCETW
jgi:hypothetical protein